MADDCCTTFMFSHARALCGNPWLMVSALIVSFSLLACILHFNLFASPRNSLKKRKLSTRRKNEKYETNTLIICSEHVIVCSEDVEMLPR